jgi:hypothetical protein
MAKIAVLVCLATMLFTGSARAGTLTFNLEYEFSGSGAGNLSPGLKITLDDGGGTGSVTLTIDATGMTPSSIKIDGVYLNVSGNNLGGMSFAHTSGPSATVSIGPADNYKADGDGHFDILLDFPNGGAAAFTPGEISKYTITRTGLTANSFNDISVNGPVGNTGYRAAAHILGLGPTGNDSGWYTETPTNGLAVPEPSTVVLALVGGLAVLGVRMRRRSPVS